jgi:diguanylate cyclase (GGDEF)-like protein
LPNRAALTGELAGLIERHHIHGVPFSLVMFEIDDFTKLNNSHGSACGEDILRQVANLVRSLSRSTDMVARYGSAEFVVLLPGAPAEIALKLVERLCRMIEQHRFWTTQLPSRLALTISTGVAACPDDGSSIEALLDRATDSLHSARLTA